MGFMLGASFETNLHTFWLKSLVPVPRWDDKAKALWNLPKCIEVEVFLQPFPPVLIVLGEKPAKGPEYLGQWKKLLMQAVHPSAGQPNLTPSLSPGFSLDLWRKIVGFPWGRQQNSYPNLLSFPLKLFTESLSFWQEASTVSSAIILTPESLENQDQRREIQVDLCGSSCIFHSMQSLSILVLSSLMGGASLSALGALLCSHRPSHTPIIF